jgi:hypothetical protein
MANNGRSRVFCIAPAGLDKRRSKMAKRLTLIALLFFIPALAKADSYVSVTLSAVNVNVLSPDTIGASFIWDTTTAQLSDFTVTSTGPDFSFAPSGYTVQGQVIKEVDFFSTKNNQRFRLEYVDDFFHAVYEGRTAPVLSSAPGTYVTFNEAEGFLTGFDIGWEFGTATVTSLGNSDHDGDDPVSAAEPASLLNLAVGLGGLGLTCLIGGRRRITGYSAATANS